MCDRHRCLVGVTPIQADLFRIWIFHAKKVQFGANPFMRTLFFKIATLLQHPILPVFVFGAI